jgi:Fic family protein
MASESVARPRAARGNSHRVAARETLIEIEILLQRLMHLTAPPPDEQTALLEAARQLYQSRRLRDRIFGISLFADPAWDILLDLFIAKREGRKVTISSACAAASAPTSTAARHIAHLVQKRLVVRVSRQEDARSSYLELTAAGDRKLTQLFREVEQSADDRV